MKSLLWCPGFVLDLSTKVGFSTQWVADYLKHPLRLKRNSLYHKWGVRGELCTSLFSFSSLATSPALALQLWIKLHSFSPQQDPEPHCCIQGTALRGSQTRRDSQHSPRAEEAPAATALAGRTPWGELPKFLIPCLLAFLVALRFFYSRH